MLVWTLSALVSLATAGDLDDASALLSRYPAGHVPDSEVVFSAIQTLQERGSAEHLSILESLREYEQPEIQIAASGALAIVTLRARLERREAFVAPDTRAIRRWLSEQPAPLRRSDGSLLGREEQAVVAYASLVVGGSHRLIGTTPEALLREGERLEDAAEPGAALAAYALAAAQGSQQALTSIAAFGVDPERLLLGLSTADGGLLPMPPETLDVLTQAGAESTVAVLVERSTAADQLQQVVALDALAQMLRRDELPAAARREARQRLEDASKASAAPVRAFALSALDDVD